MTFELVDTHIYPSQLPLPAKIAGFVEEGLARSRAIDCFDFVPSHAGVLFALLSALPPGRFCEWGSGIGIGVGIAEMLGFQARGIEIDKAMAEAARCMLSDFNLTASIETGSYFDSVTPADVYFVYTWPSGIRPVEEHFLASGAEDALLLICYGAADVRCKARRRSDQAGRA